MTIEAMNATIGMADMGVEGTTTTAEVTVETTDATVHPHRAALQARETLSKTSPLGLARIAAESLLLAPPLRLLRCLLPLPHPVSLRQDLPR